MDNTSSDSRTWKSQPHEIFGANGRPNLSLCNKTLLFRAHVFILLYFLFPTLTIVTDFHCTDKFIYDPASCAGVFSQINTRKKSVESLAAKRQT